MKPLRVVFLATCFPRPGRDTFGIWALLQAAALQRQGAQLTVVSPTSWIPRFLRGMGGSIRIWAECPAELDIEGVHVVYPRWYFYQKGFLKRWDFRRPWFQHFIGWLSIRRQLRRLIRELRPDVIYAHHTWVSGDLARRLSAEFNIPFVVTDLDFEEVEECEQYPKRRDYFVKIISRAAWMAPVARRLERGLLKMVPGARTMANPCCSDHVPQKFLQTPRPPELTDKIVILSVAAMFERKNMPGLIRVFDRVAKEHPRAVLRVVGSGNDLPAVEEALKQAAHRDRVELLGMQPHDRVMQEMVWCDVFALIGWNEPFATVYPEAMSAGKPILCCNDGGVTDFVVDGVHGLTIPPRDEAAAVVALGRLVGDEQLRKRLSSAASKLYEQYLTWDENARRLLRVLQQSAEESQAHSSGVGDAQVVR